MTELGVLLAAVAAVTGVWLLVLGWIDRPELHWKVVIHRPKWHQWPGENGMTLGRALQRTDPHDVGVEVRAIGSGVAHNVLVRNHGCGLKGDAHEELRAIRMTAESRPIECALRLPSTAASPAMLEINWVNLRPRRQNGYRIDLRGPDDQPGEIWHWYWRSLRFENGRLRRTRGEWRPQKDRRHPDIPEPILERQRGSRVPWRARLRGVGAAVARRFRRSPVHRTPPSGRLISSTRSSASTDCGRSSSWTHESRGGARRG